jgi:hypothetical protein
MAVLVPAGGANSKCAKRRPGSYRGNRIEVTNSCAQSSQAQAWQIRPWRLNLDCSAISSTLPQRGQLGRPKFRVAAVWVSQANWMLIVDSPRRYPTAPRSVSIVGKSCKESMAPLRRVCETLVAAAAQQIQFNQFKMSALCRRRAGFISLCRRLIIPPLARGRADGTSA